MAVLDLVRRIIIRGSAEGVREASGQVRELAAAHDKMAASANAAVTVTDTASKKQLDLSRSLQAAERRFNSTLRAQMEFEKVQRQMNMVVAQNPQLQARANAVLALAAQHFDQATKGQRALHAATQASSEGLRGFAMTAGPLGPILMGMGPGGLAAAAGIGAAAIALGKMVNAATALANRAGQLKDFSETTGFTVQQLQALEKAGAQVGVSAESVSRGLERFSVIMADVQLRTGETYEKLLALNPQLAREVANAESLQKAYNLVADAIKRTDLERANQIARAFFGRSGIEQTRLMRAASEVGGIEGLIRQLKQVDLITEAQADRWDKLGDQIAENMKAAKQNIAATFTEDVLLWMERLSRAFLEFSREVKQFGLNDDLRKFMDFMTDKRVQGAIAGGLAGMRVGGAVGAVAGAGAGALMGHAVMEQEKQDIAEAREELTKQIEAREKAIEKLEYYKRLANAPDNAWAEADRQRADKYAGALERINERIAKYTAIVRTAQPRITVDSPNVEKAADAQEQLRKEIIGSFNDLQRWMNAMGRSATMAERYEFALKRVEAQKASGELATNKAVSAEESYERQLRDIKRQLELQLGVADQRAVTEERLGQIREVASKAGLSNEQTRLALQIATAEAKERENAAWRRANPEMALAVDYAEQLAKSLVAVAMGTGSVSDAFKSLSATLANDAIRSLFKGDLFAAGLQTLGAVVTGGLSALFDDADAKALQKAKEEFAGMRQEVEAFIRAASGLDLSPIASAIYSIKQQADQLWMAAMKANDVAAATRIVWSFVRQVDAQISTFLNRDANDSDALRQIKNLQTGAAQLNQALADVSRSSADTARAIDESLVAQIKAVQDQVRRGLQQEINEAEGRGFLNELNDLLDRFHQLKNEQGITGVDTSLIDRWLATQAQKIVDNAELVGDEFAILSQMFPQLTGVVHESTAAIEKQAEAQKELQKQLDVAARSIVDYISDLRSGPNSNLSPQMRLAAAQATYNATLTLAQANNADALSRITQDFENLRQAAQEFYGSSLGYQNILNTGINQLLALPAVQTSADPIVQALLNVQNAVQLTTQAVNTGATGTISRLDTTVTRLNDNIAAVNAGAAGTFARLDTTVIKLDTTIGRLDSSISLLIQSLNQMIASNNWLASINNIENTAVQQLTLLKEQFTNTGAFATTATVVGANGQLTSIGVNNSMLTALNKIVINTAATAWNTSVLVVHGSSITNRSLTGVYATGGTLPAGGLGLWGEHHPEGPWVLQAGSMPVPINPSLPPGAGGMKEAIVALVNEIVQLKAEVAMLRQENVNGHTRTAQRVRENTEHREDLSGRNSQNERLAARRAYVA